MNNLKKEEESTMPKNDKLNNSETEYFKSSNEIKVLDIISKVKAEKAEMEAMELKRNIKIFKRKLRSVIQAQLDMVDDIEKVDFESN